MKIRNIEWNNHPILGNLSLDFVNRHSGDIYETIVFAGENGTGKSTILEEISSFLNYGPFNNFAYIEYVVDGEIYKAVPMTDDVPYGNFFDLLKSDGSIEKIRHDRNYNTDHANSNDHDIRYFGCILSRARSDYKTQKITGTSTSKLDVGKYDTDINEDFTSLKQLIVDVVNQDNSEYVEVNKTLAGAPRSWDDFYPTSKLFRFKNSFDNFFGNLSFKGVSDEEDEKTIRFTKHGKSIAIDRLSTGEKQIVFRGIYLLRNSGLLQNAAIMIDEPELSMHPKWQVKILQYYRGLFKDAAGQEGQIFFATHSDHVLKQALTEGGKCVVIVLERSGDTVANRKIDAPSVLPVITSAETNFLAFDLISNDYHIELYGWLQDKESKSTVKSCDAFIAAHPHYNQNAHSKSSAHGQISYSTLPTYIRNAIHHPDSGNTFTDSELRTSIQLLVELCK